MYDAPMPGKPVTPRTTKTLHLSAEERTMLRDITAWTTPTAERLSDEGSLRRMIRETHARLAARRVRKDDANS